MRALGPGSVSSVLKIALDAAFFALCLAVVGVLIGIALLALIGPEQLNLHFAEETGPIPDVSVMFGLLAFALLALGGTLVIVQSLRRVFATLTQGEPFQLDNVRRLRVIGFALIGLELLAYAGTGLGAAFAPEAVQMRFSADFTAWFAILVVFVLAEVFREGARLRRDAELTI